jgi:formylglycine-generating enzyme required for sulfatase activity
LKKCCQNGDCSPVETDVTDTKEGDTAGTGDGKAEDLFGKDTGKEDSGLPADTNPFDFSHSDVSAEDAPFQSDVSTEDAPYQTDTNLSDGTTQKDTTGEVPQLEMIYIEGDSFSMGCDAQDSDCMANEKPNHPVTVSSFYISKTEITVAQFRKCIEDGGCQSVNYEPYDSESVINKLCNYGRTGRDDHPMNCVSWNGATEFVQWLYLKTGIKYRLPYEAEWEFAARNRGKDWIYPWGDSPEPTCNSAVISACPVEETQAVCSKSLFGNTEQGLCDMIGNTAEWTKDFYDQSYYETSPVDNPTGPENGEFHVLRGGNFQDPIERLRCSQRWWTYPNVTEPGHGFRVAYSAE